jgi:hypothetical protein
MTDELRVDYADLDTLARAPRNPKRHDLGALQASLDRFGFVAPILVDDATGRLVAGHGRLDALQALKASGAAAPDRVRVDGDRWLVPVIRGVAFASPLEAESYLVADNQTTILGGWDSVRLAELLADLAEQQALAGTGFDAAAVEALLSEVGSGGPGARAAGDATAARATLAERFLVPPFSVLDARQGYWQTRKAAWLALGIESELGRGGAPGGSPRPAAQIADNGRTARGDGRGRPLA